MSDRFVGFVAPVIVCAWIGGLVECQITGTPDGRHGTIYGALAGLAVEIAARYLMKAK